MIQIKVVATQGFQHAYRHLPFRMQRIVDSKIEQLANNAAHPSLQAHRLRQAEAENVWSC